ncbi:MAG: RCC1 domain-containing protein, partial [Myxococcaceae bacterium]
CTMDGAGQSLACYGLAAPDGGLGAPVTQLAPPRAVLADGRLVTWDRQTGAVSTSTRHTGVAAIERFVDEESRSIGEHNICLLLLDGGVACDDWRGNAIDWPWPSAGPPKRLVQPSPTLGLCAEWDDGLRCAWGRPLGGDAGYDWQLAAPIDAGFVVGGIPAERLPSAASYAARGRDVYSWSGALRFSMQHDVVAMTSALAGTQTCLLTDAREVWCWGKDQHGGLGQRTGNRDRPVELHPPDQGAMLLAVSSVHTAVVSGSTVWQSGGYSALPDAGSTVAATIGSAEALAMTESWGLCAIRSDHQAACCYIYDGGCDLDDARYALGEATAIADDWGPRGEPGVVDFQGTLRAARWNYDDAGFGLVPVATDVAAIAPGCALFRDGGVACQSGSTRALVPVALPAASLAISAGYWLGFGACALLPGDRVFCWHPTGGPAPLSVPVQIPGLPSNIRQVVGSLLAGCALVGSNLVECWGDNAAGDGESTGTQPVPLTFAEPIRTLAKANKHTCALMESGRVLCWGYNPYGQLGFWPLVTQQPVQLTR